MRKTLPRIAYSAWGLYANYFVSMFHLSIIHYVEKFIFLYIWTFQGDNSHCYPLELDSLKGRKLLLKIEKSKVDGYDIFEKLYRVERICQDLSLIDAFDSVSFFYCVYIFIFQLCFIFYIYDNYSLFLAFPQWSKWIWRRWMILLRCR
jgi:hypothetical protein